MRSGKSWLTGGAAVGGLAGALTATVASLCCLGPVTFFLLGAGGAVAAAGLRPFRLPLVIASGVMLGVGYWRTYGTPRTAGACPPQVGRWIRSSLTVAIVAWIAAATLWLAACTPKTRSSPHQEITANDEPLKSMFTANVGKVRIIMLVAPT
jgi:hypothetical protein